MMNLKKCIVVLIFSALLISGCQRTVNNQTGSVENQGSFTPLPNMEIEKNVNPNEIELVKETPILSPPPSSSPIPTSKEKEDIIFKCIHSTKAEILKMLGNDYEIVYTGAEASYEGYYYKRYGITITYVYDRDDSSVSNIQLDKGVEILAVKAGLTFSEVIGVLGEAPVYDTWFENPDNKAYRLFYKINDCIIYFFSFNKDGTDSSLSVLSGLRRNVGETRNNETGKIECYWHVDEMTGDLTKISLNGEPRKPVIINKGFIEGRIISVSENLGNDKLNPCIIVATEKDGVFTIYRSMEYKDFREFRICNDLSTDFPVIKKVECKIDSRDETPRYIIEVTTTGEKVLIRLDSINGKNGTWQIRN